MRKYWLFFIVICSLVSCTSHSDSKHLEDDAADTESESVDSGNNTYLSDDKNSKIEDGTHTATVDYYNPETGYRQTYNLDVEVENGEVVQINFPNGGWLDASHITPEYLDENGTAVIYGEDGKTYDVEIDE
jgi:hypothetical protein